MSKIYVGESTLFSNDYSGQVMDLSKRGCSLSTTHISMVLLPDEQEDVVKWLVKNRRDLVEKHLKGVE
jgi:hypothetical protein